MSKAEISEGVKALLRDFHSEAKKQTDIGMEIGILEALRRSCTNSLRDLGCAVERRMTVDEFRLMIGGYKLGGRKEILHQKIYQFFPKRSSRYWMIHCGYNPKNVAAQFACWANVLISVEVCNEHPDCAILYGDSYNLGNEAADSGRAKLDTLRELEGGEF